MHATHSGVPILVSPPAFGTLPGCAQRASAHSSQRRRGAAATFSVMSTDLMDEFQRKTTHMIELAKRCEARGKASWPASMTAAAEVRSLLGGAVFELKRPDDTLVFSYSLRNNSALGVTDAGLVCVHPAGVKRQ